MYKHKTTYPGNINYFDIETVNKYKQNRIAQRCVVF